jgi:hypothetical protein
VLGSHYRPVSNDRTVDTMTTRATPAAGGYRGIEGFAGILRRLRDETNGTIALSPTSVVADDDNLIARAHVTAERGRKHLDTENCYAFRFVEGKVADGQVFLADPAQVDDFFA